MTDRPELCPWRPKVGIAPKLSDAELLLIACCDGLTGLPDALEATWPKVVVQTCVVQLIRGSTRFRNWKDRKPGRRGRREQRPSFA